VKRLLVIALAAGMCAAQDRMKVTKVPSSYDFMWLDQNTGTVAELVKGGDFTFYDDAGKVVLVLRRTTKGDLIHERLATLLIRVSSQQWDLKDWRDWSPR
jgi:hypothetical protein